MFTILHFWLNSKRVRFGGIFCGWVWHDDFGADGRMDAFTMKIFFEWLWHEDFGADGMVVLLFNTLDFEPRLERCLWFWILDTGVFELSKRWHDSLLLTSGFSHNKAGFFLKRCLDWVETASSARRTEEKEGDLKNFRVRNSLKDVVNN